MTGASRSVHLKQVDTSQISPYPKYTTPRMVKRGRPRAYDRFMLAVSQIEGKRLTYAELTGKVGETQGF